MNPKQKRYHRLYMDIASRVAEMSYAVRAKVGCVIVKDGNIISMGWNGMPAGMTNVCEISDDAGVLFTKPEVSHAEENALAKLAKGSYSSENAVAYITLEPCIHCAKLLYSAGIKDVYYRYSYKSQDGINYLKKLDVNVVQFTIGD